MKKNWVQEGEMVVVRDKEYLELRRLRRSYNRDGSLWRI
jgi:hypothetical protein